MENKLTLLKEDMYDDHMKYWYGHNGFYVIIDQECDMEKKILFEATLAHEVYGNGMVMLVAMRTSPDKQVSLDEFVRQVEDLLEDYEAYYEIMNWQDRIRMEEFLADLDDDAESETA